jgi:uncharacterized protein
MKRALQSNLDQWIVDPMRKPLILRGARQVGKTWLVRDLALRNNKELLELNFERDPAIKRLFTSNDPNIILGEISLWIGRTINRDKVLLFLDEIQAAGEILAKLRWFAEEMPQLPVIAAGSLLEFVLTEHTFSIPVGRVAFLHVEPMFFPEYLAACGQDLLLDRLTTWRPQQEFSTTLHEQALTWFYRYCMVGGMPAVVACDVAGLSPSQIRERQYDLAAAFRSDFSKYDKRLNSEILEATLNAVAGSLGKKFIYAHVRADIKQLQAQNALAMLINAKICHIVKHSAANGLPLGGEIKESLRKVILNDVGLLHALQRTPAQDMFPQWDTIAPQVRMQIIEQVVGQQLRRLGPLSGDGPQLYYWQREGGRPGEIDYLIQIADRIVPVELKSGPTGSMKSLHQFMFDKKLMFALRFDSNSPSQFDIATKTTQGDSVEYRLRSLPYYMAGFRSEEMIP